MHELAICQALVKQVEQVAREYRGQLVERIEISVGPLSGVEPQLLQQSFPLAAAGSLTESAQLCIKESPVRVHCEACCSDSEASINRLICGQCGNWRTSLISGDELLLTSVQFIREASENV